MKIDLFKLREQEMLETEIDNFKNRPISDETKLLSIDITFDDNQTVPESISDNQSPFMGEIYGVPIQQKTHLGIQSCALVKFYAENYPCLKEVTILLKKFMAIHDLNSPYYGGISAYSTVIILVAYMNYFGLKKS